MTILQAIELLKKYNSSQKQRAKKTNTDITEVDQALSRILVFLDSLKSNQFIITSKKSDEILPQPELDDFIGFDYMAYDISGSLWLFKGERPIASRGSWKIPKGGSKKCLIDCTFEELEEKGTYLNYEDSLTALYQIMDEDDESRIAPDPNIRWIKYGIFENKYL